MTDVIVAKEAPARPPHAARLRAWAQELGFASLGVADLDLSEAGPRLTEWIARGLHGELDYMARHQQLRLDPRRLVPGVISALMGTIHYAPADPDWLARAWRTLADHERAYVSRYALGRDYHKVVRQRLQRLADRIADAVGPFGYRVFCDSAPVMEVELARKAGLGWRGKHTLLIEPSRGSTFFLGSLLTDLPLAPDRPASADHCGSCRRCIDACPTGAIVEPYRIDARRCISYLTIELKGAIPQPLRPLIGNRIYGCDDCQLACPWNKFAQPAATPEFSARHGLDSASLIELFGWDTQRFDECTQGSAIRRIGHERWLRNIAVALGNALADSRPRSDTSVDGDQGAPRDTGARMSRAAIVTALRARADDPSPLVREHVAWALARGGQPGTDHRTSDSHTGNVASDATIDSVTSRAT